MSVSTKPPFLEKPTLKNFTIPIKRSLIKDGSGGREFTLVDLKPGSSDVQISILKDLLSNSTHNNKAVYCYQSMQLVKNTTLSHNFTKRKKEFFHKSVSSKETFAFVLLSGDSTEIDYICKNGLAVGTSFLGDIGSSSQGVYLSKYFDLVSPAPFFDGLALKILVVKVILGRRKEVGLGSCDMDADPLFNSHYVQTPTNSQRRLTRLDLFRYSQLFVYEHDSSLNVVHYPRSILPHAVVRFSCKSPTYRLQNLKDPERMVWEGIVEFGPQAKLCCAIISANRAPKPLFLEGTLNLSTLVQWRKCVQDKHLSALLTPDCAGSIHRVRELPVEIDGQTVYASYYTIVSKSREFEKIVNAMRTEHVAAVFRKSEKTMIFAIPNGELTSVLSLPSLHFPVFHVLTFSPQAHVRLSRTSPLEEKEYTIEGPSLGQRVEGDSTKLQTVFAELLKKRKSTKAALVAENFQKEKVLHVSAQMDGDVCVIGDEEPMHEAQSDVQQPELAQREKQAPCEMTSEQIFLVLDLPKIEKYVTEAKNQKTSPLGTNSHEAPKFVNDCEQAEIGEDIDESMSAPSSSGFSINACYTTPTASERLEIVKFGIPSAIYTPTRPSNIYVPKPPPNFCQPIPASTDSPPPAKKPFSLTSPSNLFTSPVWNRVVNPAGCRFNRTENTDKPTDDDILIIDESDFNGMKAPLGNACYDSNRTESGHEPKVEHSDFAKSGLHFFPVNIPTGCVEPRQVAPERPFFNGFSSGEDVDLRLLNERGRLDAGIIQSAVGSSNNVNTNQSRLYEDDQWAKQMSRPYSRNKKGPLLSRAEPMEPAYKGDWRLSRQQNRQDQQRTWATHSDDSSSRPGHFFYQ